MGNDKCARSDASKPLLIGIIIGGCAIFFLSIGVGLWVAYDRWLALLRFVMVAGGFICLGILPWLLKERRDFVLAIIMSSCSFFASGLGLVFLLTHDWHVGFAGDFQPLSAVTEWVQWLRPAVGLTTGLPPLQLHENAVAGALIILLPIGGVNLSRQWRQHRFMCALLEGSALSMATFALLLTFSRGAWIGLGGGIAITYLATYHGRGRMQWPWAFVCGMLLMSIGIVTFVIEPRLLTILTQFGAWSASSDLPSNRLRLWQDAVTLVGDYWFTGSGLQSTAMVLSSYVYLLHVPYLAHGHNFYLQLAIEQGAPALLAFGMVTGSILWCSRHHLTQSGTSHHKALVGATIALLALLLHGWFDAELYVSRLTPLIFLPLGLIGAVLAPAPWARLQTGGSASALVIGAVVPVMVIILIASGLGLPSLYLVNQATVAQTRAELTVYQWPSWPLQDAVRQRFPAQFVTITARYQAALQQNPANVAALRRLGQIRLSQEAYAAARRDLEAAYRLAPDQRATRQLLGEIYALAGDEAGAHRLWQTIDLLQGQLRLRIEWYAQTGNFKNVLQLAKVVHTTTGILEQ